MDAIVFYFRTEDDVQIAQQILVTANKLRPSGRGYSGRDENGRSIFLDVCDGKEEYGTESERRYANFGRDDGMPLCIVLSYRTVQVAIDAIFLITAAVPVRVDDDFGTLDEGTEFVAWFHRGGSWPVHPEHPLKDAPDWKISGEAHT